jgi:hypothetical protein
MQVYLLAPEPPDPPEPDELPELDDPVELDPVDGALGVLEPVFELSPFVEDPESFLAASL